jgi:hypothetical protein
LIQFRRHDARQISKPILRRNWRPKQHQAGGQKDENQRLHTSLTIHPFTHSPIATLT